MIKQVIVSGVLLVMSNAALSADLGLEIRNCVPGKVVMAALYDKAKSFEDDRHGRAAFAVTSALAERSTLKTSFRGIKPGRYAVAVYADLNGNHELDSNFVGMPTEPYGFSRDARSSFGVPSFEQAAFEVGEVGIEQIIHLQ
ncbi:MAG: DUF2141 domain-containing protein [Pseudomonadota bacterium]